MYQCHLVSLGILIISPAGQDFTVMTSPKLAICLSYSLWMFYLVLTVYLFYQTLLMLDILLIIHWPYIYWPRYNVILHRAHVWENYVDQKLCMKSWGRDDDFPPHLWWRAHFHYDDVIMDTMSSQITSHMIVYSTVYSDADQREHQSSASLAFVLGIHRGPVNSPHKWPVTRQMYSFDDVIM